MITVKVDFYKDTGKWYTGYEFTSEVRVFETDEIERTIRDTYGILDMDYTFEAEEETEDGIALNKRLVKTRS